MGATVCVLGHLVHEMYVNGISQKDTFGFL